MKKITKIMALILAVAVVFSGCMTQEDTYKIDAKNKKVTISTKAEIDKAKYISFMRKSDPTIKTDGEADKAIRTNLKESYEGTGYAVSISTTTKDDVEYYIINLRHSQSIEEYNTENASMGSGYISTEAFYSSIEAGGTINQETLDMYKEMGITEEDINAIKFKTTIEFPNKIVLQQNGNISETNPNVVTFEYGATKSVVLFASTNSNVTVSSIKKEIKNKYEIKNYKRVKRPSIKSVKVTSVKNKKGTIKIKIKKVENATYEVQYSTNKKFKKAKVKQSKKTTITIKKLKAGKKYYFRVRAVAIPSDRYYYENDISKYSKKKSVVIKKK